MKKDLIFPDFQAGLEDILREGARKLLHQAIENEVTEHLKSQEGSRGVKRNGYL